MGEAEPSRNVTPAIGHPRRRHVDPNAHAARPPPMMPSIINRVKRLAAILALLALAAAAPPPTTCGQGGDYAAALCAYQRRNFPEAAAGFRAIVEKNADAPETVRATYFLARTEMKLGRFDEAQTLFIRIYALDAPFYRAWSCDFLLGECRRAAGKD